nr:antibiotic biosynthesis monooxygenase [Raoultella sp. NCTC 9187]
MPCSSCAIRRIPSICASSWRGQAALEEHIALPHFQDFIAQMDGLLAEPLRLDYLTAVEP